jgi:hypothetical protein
MTLYLYVWKKVLSDYTDGIAFAVAHDVEEALLELNKQAGYPLDLPIDKMKKYDLSKLKKPIAAYVYGGG